MHLERARMSCGIDSLSPEALRVIGGYSYGSVSFREAMIGRVLGHLEATGLLDRTLVLFTADHGDLLGDVELLRGRGFARSEVEREDLLKVPISGMGWRWY